MTATATPPIAAPGAPGTRRLILIIVSLVLALVPLQLDSLVAATATPTIAGDLGGFGQIAWIATAYLLTMAIGTVLAGRLGDMFGRKRMLLIALALFLGASALAGFAGSMGMLITARALQGLGGGMTFTTLLAVVADVVPPAKRARYQGLLGAIAPFSMIIGPWIGGIITDGLGWRWIFFLNLPLIALSIVGAVLLLRLPSGRRGGRVDAAGLALISVVSTGAVLAVTWGGHQHDWLSVQVIGAGAIAIAAAVALVFVERRAAHPILPPDLFRNRAVLMSFLVMFFASGAVMLAAVNYLPLFLQFVQGRSAGSSGLLLLPILLPAIGVALLIGGWTNRGSRFRTAMVIGTALLLAGCMLLATMGTGTSAWLTGAYMIVAGAGIGFLFQTPLVLVQNSSPAGEVGAATGAASFLRTIGGALGVGAFGALYASTVSAHVAAHATGATHIDIASITPSQLAGLPDAVRSVVASAVANANSVLFVAAAGAAVLALVAALIVPRAQKSAAVRRSVAASAAAPRD